MLSLRRNCPPQDQDFEPFVSRWWCCLGKLCHHWKLEICWKEVFTGVGSECYRVSLSCFQFFQLMFAFQEVSSPFLAVVTVLATCFLVMVDSWNCKPRIIIFLEVALVLAFIVTTEKWLKHVMLSEHVATKPKYCWDSCYLWYNLLTARFWREWTLRRVRWWSLYPVTLNSVLGCLHWREAN